MISFIKGSAEIFKEKTIIIENSGIGYKIFVTDRVIEYVSKNNQNVKIYTYMNVKEDEISLFGFLDKDELNIFEKRNIAEKYIEKIIYNNGKIEIAFK